MWVTATELIFVAPDGGRETFPAGTPAEAVAREDLSANEVEGLERTEKWTRRENPDARVVAVRLGGRVRWAFAGTDVVPADAGPIRGGRAGATARPGRTR